MVKCLTQEHNMLVTAWLLFYFNLFLEKLRKICRVGRVNRIGRVTPIKHFF